ncbi:uroporphyrinogen-III synthase [Tsuneonella flava]|uniref:Uroporphyrinogen-III synthase n=1 Tax=Tsuneonella flava TaxID=2055955 RepID=A0ABX7KCP7_9SPHN|nr:uroporphyrinogen-III synthase [Tsuneonella flava]QSB45588.1 uroporphyrinogen-III synthase [Tsuneonella flava]
MPRPAIVLRPEPGLSETLKGLRDRGIEGVAAPLFAIEPVSWDAPDPADFDAILVGSANVFRHGGRALNQIAGLPVHAVGARTAQAARDAGFAVAETGAGGLQALLDRARAPVRFLRLAGEKHVALSSPAGVQVVERIVYRAAPLPLAEDVAAQMAGGAVVLLHSGEAARDFADECKRLEVDRSEVSLAALAPRIASAAGEGWQSVAWAMKPAELALLALAVQMCQ